MADRTIARKRMAMVFNEWAKRYIAAPEEFRDFKNEDGKLIDDYGEGCAAYFEKLADEMDAKGILPRPKQD